MPRSLITAMSTITLCESHDCLGSFWSRTSKFYETCVSIYTMRSTIALAAIYQAIGSCFLLLMTQCSWGAPLSLCFFYAFSGFPIETKFILLLSMRVILQLRHVIIIVCLSHSSFQIFCPFSEIFNSHSTLPTICEK